MEDPKPDPPSIDRTADKDFAASDGPSAREAAASATPLPPGTPVTAVFQPNQLLAGRFKVIRFVARGGMGEVYEAEDEELQERVAVKTARFENQQTAHDIERFRREIQLARKVTHPNVCRTFDVFRHGIHTEEAARTQILIVSMEWLEGETLNKRIRDAGRLSTTEAWPLVEQMCAGLGAAHRVGVVHRDFKSSNVMLVKSAAGGSAGSGSGAGARAETLRAVITDFGLAHAEEHDGGTLTRMGDILGTPAYMAPEQIEGGAITPATDIYALGIVIYEMLTGSLPFAADTPLATAMKRLKQSAPSPRMHVPELDARWEMVVARCLERDPEQRFANTEEIVRALRGEAVAASSGSAAGVAAGSGTAQRFARWKVPVAIAAVLVVLAALGIFMMQRRTSQKVSDQAREGAASATAPGTRKSLAVLGFQNLSGNKDADALGNILTDSLWSQLDTGQIRFIPPTRVDEMKQNLGIGRAASDLSKEQMEAVRKFLGADILVTGGYTVSGAAEHRSVEWNIHLLNAANGESLGSVEQSGSQADLNSLVVHAGRLVRQQWGLRFRRRKRRGWMLRFRAMRMRCAIFRKRGKSCERLRCWPRPNCWRKRWMPIRNLRRRTAHWRNRGTRWGSNRKRRKRRKRRWTPPAGYRAKRGRARAGNITRRRATGRKRSRPTRSSGRNIATSRSMDCCLRIRRFAPGKPRMP